MSISSKSLYFTVDDESDPFVKQKCGQSRGLLSDDDGAGSDTTKSMDGKKLVSGQELVMSVYVADGKVVQFIGRFYGHVRRIFISVPV